MRFVSANGAEMRSLTRRVDTEWIRDAAKREQGVAFELRAQPNPVDVLVGAVGSAPNPRSGKPMRTMDERAATPTSMAVYDRFAATSTRRVPREYIVRSSTSRLIEAVAQSLAAHGVRFERARIASRRQVEQFVLTTVARNGRLFQGHHEATVTGRFEIREVDVPAGSIVVRTDQPLGRVAFYLLEPESNDSLSTWNVLDADLAPGRIHPVLKSR
jgi:hypothetical protein